MAREKYDWKKIKADYEIGKSKSYIHKKYGVPYSTLSTKISREVWEIANNETSAISEFRSGCEQVSEVIANNSDNKEKVEAIVDELNTIMQDNELVINNRILLKSFQGLISSGIKNGIYESPQDIKSGVSAIKDIESVANPQKGEITVSTQNNTQNNTQNINIELTEEEAKEKALELGVPLSALINH